ncbi:MAG: NADP-dependent malic enzyme, partial [Betaproteobacteria bacterium]|nr:NADP-dependent malic enzyme [Betaproteobacteria bacterium]
MADQETNIREDSLAYHRRAPAGKIALLPTKQLTNQRDLALAYSPGVAAACEEIVRDPREVSTLTARGNLVGVVTNGTAVLGLGSIGPLAAKPVMEGKAVLFKKFAGLDCFDIELAERDPDKLVDMICALEPTFGGINLEDIKSPECFYIERKCRERMKIPVFHDDQHGTAIIVGAAVLNGLRVVGKDFAKVKLVCSGAGAAALACLDLLVDMGLRRENIFVADIKGVVWRGRTEEMDDNKARYAQPTAARTLAEILPGADIFLGLSAGRVLKPEWLPGMADKPLILALANPEPEIMPDIAKAARPDAIIATGRSDFPNQVNNVLCFPFIFRGALDVGATTINEAMKLAAVRALADLATVEQSDVVTTAYNLHENLRFGPDYLIPRPFDPRLIVMIAPAVARAAMDSGVATRPIEDFDAYRTRLTSFVYHSGLLMKPIFSLAKQAPKRIVYAEGEDERVLRAVQVVVDEGLAQPILVGRPAVLAQRIERFGLRLKPDVDFQTINPDSDPRFRSYWTEYFRLTQRKGVSQQYAQIEMRRRLTLIGAMMIHHGDADGMLCGTFGTHALHLHYVAQVIGLRAGVRHFAAMNVLMLPKRTVFICDTYVTPDPDPEHIAEMTALAAEEVRRFGIVPKVALLSASNFGSVDTPSARKMQQALAILRERAPELEVEGEMHGDAALSEEIRLQVFPHARFRGEANLLIMPTLDAANIAFNLLKTAAGDG